MRNFDPLMAIAGMLAATGVLFGWVALDSYQHLDWRWAIVPEQAPSFFSVWALFSGSVILAVAALIGSLLVYMRAKRG